MRPLLLIAFITVSFLTQAQNELASRFLVYPAGKIATVQFSKGSEKGWIWTAEVGYNFARRQDFGVHDNEEGGGAGLGTGLRKYFSPSKSGFYVETNCQLWLMEIDWRDIPDVGLAITGVTKITVLQPTLGAGYSFRSKSEKWTALVGLSLGREINIKTIGEDVGEGGISLLSFSVSRRL